MSFEPSATEPPRSARVPTCWNQAAIRCLDLGGSSVGLIFLSPLFLALALAVKVTSPGPVFFRSVRVGQNARSFALFKFRSMVMGAPTFGPAVTTAKDPRITRVGGILRRLKLDELPQLLNVLKGEMSLVGPRPENPAYVALYSHAELAILDAKPGMTSPASVRYRDEANQLIGENWEDFYIHEVMPAKLAIDLDYMGRRTLLSDIKVILSTIVGSHDVDGKLHRPTFRQR